MSKPDWDSDEFTAPSLMLGPVKLMVFYDDHHHGPQCLLARATAWLSHPKNADWSLLDIKFDPVSRIVEGELQSSLALYVQDTANEIKPLAVLEEPFFNDHLKRYAEKEREKEREMRDAGIVPMDLNGVEGFAMAIDPTSLIGTREEVAEKLREQGVPDFVIDMMLGGGE